MFWDKNFWETIITSYISSVLSSVTLLVVGGIVAYFSRKKLTNTFEKIVKIVINIKNNQQIQSNQSNSSNYQLGDVHGDVNFNIEEPEVYGSTTEPKSK